MKSLIIIVLYGCFVAGCAHNRSLRILILSGSNNHNWGETTACLEQMYSLNPRFEVTVTLKPDTLSSAFLKNFDVVVSNWNSWPENDLRWSVETEKSLEDFIRNGGGLVTFHSSTSVFYAWPEFREMTTASWEPDTRHGKPDTTFVQINGYGHVITAGFRDFEIFDELWINARENSAYTVMGSATDRTLQKGGVSSQPAIMVREFGKGRIFHTILGHDARAMENSGFVRLMLRGTEWAATGKVKQRGKTG